MEFHIVEWVATLLDLSFSEDYLQLYLLSLLTKSWQK